MININRSYKILSFLLALCFGLLLMMQAATFGMNTLSTQKDNVILSGSRNVMSILEHSISQDSVFLLELPEVEFREWKAGNYEIRVVQQIGLFWGFVEKNLHSYLKLAYMLEMGIFYVARKQLIILHEKDGKSRQIK